MHFASADLLKYACIQTNGNKLNCYERIVYNSGSAGEMKKNQNSLAFEYPYIPSILGLSRS